MKKDRGMNRLCRNHWTSSLVSFNRSFLPGIYINVKPFINLWVKKRCHLHEILRFMWISVGFLLLMILLFFTGKIKSTPWEPACGRNLNTNGGAVGLFVWAVAVHFCLKFSSTLTKLIENGLCAVNLLIVIWSW